MSQTFGLKSLRPLWAKGPRDEGKKICQSISLSYRASQVGFLLPGEIAIPPDPLAQGVPPPWTSRKGLKGGRQIALRIGLSL